MGAAVSLWHPCAQWVEQHFTNGYYPHWQHLWAAVASVFPFALGDVVIVVAIAIVIAALVFVRPWWRALLGVAALAAFLGIWFYAGWGYGYDRAPVIARVTYDESRIDPAQLEALRKHAMAEINRLAPIAHADHNGNAIDDVQLRDAWLPVVQRLGDRWTPDAHPAKPALFGLVMDASGTSGFTNPFTLETQLAPDLLWFERPFNQAHEWSHAAGFNREDEANFIAALTCLRDRDPVAQYSGWFELYLYLPPLPHYKRSMFVPQVWADFKAVGERNKRFINLGFSRFSWGVYNSYLQSNHVAAGVSSYDEVTRLLLGVRLDRDGLPIARSS